MNCGEKVEFSTNLNQTNSVTDMTKKTENILMIPKDEAIALMKAKWWTLPMLKKIEEYKWFFLVHHFRSKVSRAFKDELGKVNKTYHIVNLDGEDRLMTSNVCIKGFRDTTPEKVQFT